MGTLLNTRRAGDRCLQLFILNEEFLVSAIHQIALITSLPFVHTARRYYRLNGLVRPRDWRAWRWQQLPLARREPGQTWLFRGSKSRNKAVVGEPATGSLPLKHLFACCFVCLFVCCLGCVCVFHSLTAAASEQQQQQQKLVLFPCTLMCVCGSSQHSVQWEACAFELMHATFTVCSRLSTACVSWGRSFLNLPCAKEEAMEARMYMCVSVYLSNFMKSLSPVCVCMRMHLREREVETKKHNLQRWISWLVHR